VNDKDEENRTVGVVTDKDEEKRNDINIMAVVRESIMISLVESC